MTTTLHPNDTACPEWCCGGHGRFPHTASFGSVTLSDEEFAHRNTTAEVTLTNDMDGAPAVEFGDGQHRLVYRFTLTEAEQLHESLGRAIEGARAAERHTRGSELACNEINTLPPSDRTTLVCLDCGDEVFAWSTPDLDRCWRCAELVDGSI